MQSKQQTYKLIGLIVFCLFLRNAKAQSDFDLTQRWFNESVYNPAATGNSFTTGVFLHGRKQWAGLEGSPSTQVVTFDTYVETIHSAFGLALLGDQIGYSSTYSGKLSYAYYIPTGRKSVLSLGLSAGVLNRNRNPNGVAIEVPGDPDVQYGVANEYSPDFDIGFEYKGPLKLGATVRHIGLQTSDNNLPSPALNVWTYASSRFNASNYLSIEPAVSFMYRNEISRYEMGAIFYWFKMNRGNDYNDRFWIGGMYRLQGQFAVLAGVHITPQLRLGYSFDYGTNNDLLSVSKMGSHELFLAWQLNRFFYKEASCPAYRDTRFDKKSVKKRRK